MSALAERSDGTTSPDETEISLAAIDGYRRLLRAVGRTLLTHAANDGGMICESRASRSRPSLWRVRPDGEILADAPYSFAVGEFVAVKLPVTV
jgi:hypothetical protein